MMQPKKVIIIGGGISGLSALHFIKRAHPNYDITLYEAENRLGGTIGTDIINGYSMDWGPNGFLDREPLTLRLCHELGLDEVLEKANEKVNKRFILRNGHLREVPLSPPRFLKSNILSLKGKLRLLLEPFSARLKTDLDESIYDFGVRHIGREATDYLIQPMVSGIYGGVAQKLSLKSCFPIMREMEDEYGSLFKAMIAKARKAKKSGKKSGGPGGPAGWLTSFKGGLFKLIEQLESTYGRHIVKSCMVEKIISGDSDYLVKLANGQIDRSENIVLAVPSNHASTLTKELSETLSASFGAIPYAPITVICLGYDESQIDANLDGFGFLVPQVENRNILGSIWTSSIFDNRSPSGKVQLRTMIGGDGNHESMNLTDNELIELARNDLNEILGINGEPEMAKLYRWKMGIPQFVLGHSEKIITIEQELDRLGNIFFTGNAYYGIGLNDCIKQSYKISQFF